MRSGDTGMRDFFDPVALMMSTRFRNVSVQRKIIAAFACTLIATLALGLFASNRLSEVSRHAQIIRDQYLQSVRLLGELNYWTMRVRQRQAVYLLFNTDAEHEKEAKNIQTMEGKANAVVEALQPFIEHGRERTLADRWSAKWRSYIAGQDQLFGIDKAGGRDPAVAYYNGDYKNFFNGFSAICRPTLLTKPNARAPRPLPGAPWTKARMSGFSLRWDLRPPCVSAPAQRSSMQYRARSAR